MICTIGTKDFDVYHYLSIIGEDISRAWATISLHTGNKLIKGRLEIGHLFHLATTPLCPMLGSVYPPSMSTHPVDNFILCLARTSVAYKKMVRDP